MRLQLNSNVSVVKISDDILEFFKSNTRRSIHVKVENDNLLNLVNDLDGQHTIEDLSRIHNLSQEDIQKALSFLSKKGLLDGVEPAKDFDDYNKFRRIIHFLDEYATSHSELLTFWSRIKSARICLIGLGAVGSWVAANLVQIGVQHLVLLDNDTVDISNLHRQWGYTFKDIGYSKVATLSQRLKEYNQNIHIDTFETFLEADTLENLPLQHIDLIINCADNPNVDTTSQYVAEYAMPRHIPHIIGGGYNLHLSLIGQTIIPYQTACFQCFLQTLEEQNKIDKTRVKKLAIKNRKIGSIGPMCSLIASMIGMEAIKVISQCTLPTNINRRGEFDVCQLDIQYKPYLRRDDCQWCGKNGIYYHQKC